jgi:hypothetical protein
VNLPSIGTEKLPQPLPTMSMDMWMVMSVIMCNRAGRRLSPKERVRSIRHRDAQQLVSKVR